MNAKLKKVLLIIGISIFIIICIFGAGLYTGYKITMGKYSTALAKAGELYSISERENRELKLNNIELTRLNNESKVTIGKLRESLSTAGKQVGTIADGNREAEEILHQLNDLLQSVNTSQ